MNGRATSAVLARWMPLAFAVLLAAVAIWLRQVPSLPGPSDGVQEALIGRALLAAAGKVSSGQVIADYPPIAILPMAAVHAITGLSGLAIADLLSALFAASLAGFWLSGLLKAGYRPAWALALTLLLSCNPLFLRAIAEGPQVILTLWGAWLFAVAAFALRSRGGVNDLMLISASLMMLVFTGLLGAALALAAIPFLFLTMPADIRSRSWFHVYLVLLFPVLFGLVGFAFVNWLMLHDPLASLRLPLEASRERAITSWQWVTLEIALAVASAPVLLAQYILARNRRPLQAPALALLGTLMLLVVFALQTGAARSLPVALAPAIPFAAAAVIRWPGPKDRTGRVALLLTLGCFGGGSVISGYATMTEKADANEYWRARQKSADEHLGHFLAGQSDVMLDAAMHPKVIAARGSARGVVTASDTSFALTLLSKRVRATAIAVAAPDPSRNADAINRRLPDFYVSGAEGYRLIYDREGWRVWARQSGEIKAP